jgi:23S rRNA (uracil1939-C5)-methyltransferase/tRNA (uracil-5-)-methyltransferase
VAKKPFNDFPFPYHKEIELEITTLTNLGVGLGRVPLEGVPERESGWVVMVPFSLPGEKVLARIFRNQSGHSEADLIKVLRSSKDRVEPPCSLFGTCGGCQYQHLNYEAQLEWKRTQVQELLLHMAKIEFDVSPVIASPKKYGYRSKITPHFEKPRPDRPLHIGFRQQGKRFGVVDVPECHLATEGINERLTTLREEVLEKASSYKKGVTLLLRDALEGVSTDPREIISEKVQGLALQFPAGEFFQNNPFILDAFAEYARDQAKGEGARYLIDAYCGSGLFCLTAAGSFERATGIEISEQSINWARENAKRNGLNNCEFVLGQASSIFEQVKDPADETAVIIDPPRKGSDALFLSQLIAYGPKTVVYISCNPATQIRDLQLLVEGGYEVKAVQPFDLFPQTRHLECVVTLGRE